MNKDQVVIYGLIGVLIITFCFWMDGLAREASISFTLGGNISNVKLLYGPFFAPDDMIVLYFDDGTTINFWRDSKSEQLLNLEIGTKIKIIYHKLDVGYFLKSIEVF